MRRAANYLVSLAFVIAAMLAFKLTHPWPVAFGIAFVAAMAMDRLRELLDPVTDQDDEEDEDDD